MRKLLWKYKRWRLCRLYSKLLWHFLNRGLDADYSHTEAGEAFSQLTGRKWIDVLTAD